MYVHVHFQNFRVICLVQKVYIHVHVQVYCKTYMYENATLKTHTRGNMLNVQCNEVSQNVLQW